MNLDQLKVFHTLAEKRNFSETAKLLHMSQPSVTLQIKALEEKFNAKLFERTTKQVELTEAGKILYHHTSKILHLLHLAEKEIALLVQTVHGELKIGASLTTGEYVLPKALGLFKKEYPKVKLLLEITNSEHIVQRILDDLLHLGFIEAPIFHPQLVVTPFMDDELVVIASRTAPPSLIGERYEITVDELKEVPMILREPGSGTRRVMEDALREQQIDPASLNIVLELGSTEAIKAAVESGLGISIISRSAIKKEEALGTLREVRIKNVSIRRSLYTVYHKERILQPPAEAFLMFFSDVFPMTTS
ncbi:selenium metabolism-associated LysR family transcriptional regulator [Bacillaceae bacterium]